MNTRRRITGVVVSNKMEKTVVVEISRTFQHRLYKKVVHSHRRVLAHDEVDCQIGDHVQIVESSPISRHKKWVVETIIKRDIAAGEPGLEALDTLLDAEEVMQEKLEAESIKLSESEVDDTSIDEDELIEQTQGVEAEDDSARI